MDYQIVQDDEWATVRYEKDDGYVYHTMHQPLTGDIFRKTLNKGLDTLKNNKATKWLSDDRKNGQFAPDDVEFAVADWGPRAADAGWKYWALVVPESMAGRAGMRGIVETFHKMGVHVAIFTDLEDARTWLVNM